MQIDLSGYRWPRYRPNAITRKQRKRRHDIWSSYPDERQKEHIILSRRAIPDGWATWDAFGLRPSGAVRSMCSVARMYAEREGFRVTYLIESHIQINGKKYYRTLQVLPLTIWERAARKRGIKLLPTPHPASAR